MYLKKDVQGWREPYVTKPTSRLCVERDESYREDLVEALLEGPFRFTLWPRNLSGFPFFLSLGTQFLQHLAQYRTKKVY